MNAVPVASRFLIRQYLLEECAFLNSRVVLFRRILQIEKAVPLPEQRMTLAGGHGSMATFGPSRPPRFTFALVEC
jgi:hypothetical protein